MINLTLRVTVTLDKKRRKGPEYPIILRVRLGRSEEFTVNTGRISEEAKFDNGRIKGKSYQANEDNAHIARLKARIENTWHDMVQANGGFPVRLPDFRVRLEEEAGVSRKPKTSNIDLIQLIGQYVQERHAELRPGTLDQMRTTVTILESFLSHHKHAGRYSSELRKFDFDTYTALRNFLVSDYRGIKKRAMTNASVNTRLANLKAMIRYYYDNGTPEIRSQINLDFMRFKPFKSVLKQRQALKEEEVNQLWAEDLSDAPHLERVRDLYIFCCFTGLRHGDAVSLNRTNITPTGPDQFELRWYMGKTMKPNSVPLVGPALEIISKYRDRYVTLLPPLKNNRTSANLPKLWRRMVSRMPSLAEVVEVIDQKGNIREVKRMPRYEALNFHTSRHTYARMLLAKGAPTEHVKEMLGQSDIRTTQIYAKTNVQMAISSTRLLLEMAKRK
ncbi:tyrosine-type recombinase/integrase [Rufibacter tibetensis]|uniref:Tyr recombinase domain-containing protein n=1 Tax=Rufibacter tibetensis TaxID=512763 RepID=A0A0P0CP86_9BACT|nr:site-specific integrase [Rufibacter tibetensis]ALI98076.1 hypothetical protein DC20_02660 [Rufibacter tibetensis]